MRAEFRRRNRSEEIDKGVEADGEPEEEETKQKINKQEEEEKWIRDTIKKDEKNIKGIRRRNDEGRKNKNNVLKLCLCTGTWKWYLHILEHV